MVKFSQVRISAPAAAGNEVGRDAGIHSSECPLVVNALYTNRCRIRKQSARLRCFASMCSCPFTSCWPGILPHDRTFASPGHLPVKTTIANICILCMHDFPVCSFNPAFRGCQNPINGLCFVCSLVMVRVKVIGLAFRVTVEGGYPGWGKMFYIHTAIGAKQLLGGLAIGTGFAVVWDATAQLTCANWEVRCEANWRTVAVLPSINVNRCVRFSVYSAAQMLGFPSVYLRGWCIAIRAARI